jgi:hypothetical protein
VLAADLNNLFAQLPQPCIIMGDFNAHNHLWSTTANTDPRGRIIEDFMARQNLCLWNEDSPTYLHPATGSLTSIDLTMCSPQVFLDFSWEVEEDQWGSDHYPIVLSSHYSPPDERVPKWHFQKANWAKFESLCRQEITGDLLQDVEDPIQTFTDTLYDVAKQCIPKSNPNPKKPEKPWFTEECKKAVKARKKALKKFKRQPTQYNLQRYRIKRAKARYVIRCSKKKSWSDYISKLTTRTPMKKCWDMIRRISGKGGGARIKHLNKNGQNITNPKDIANTLGGTISRNSSSANYTPKFQRIKARQERKPLNFISQNLENYNKPFSMEELQIALFKSHDTAPGPDQIHYQILKHMPVETTIHLLEIFNTIWTNGGFPPCWSEATIIPIPKPGKDSTDPNNYRPIALTSCVCKTMERMINERLVWFLEEAAISSSQSGFRKARSIMDHLVRLETLVRDGFIKGEHVVALFFDLEKAYDTTWKYGIMKDLHESGLRGRLPLFIENFLLNQCCRVCVGSTLSEAFDQEMGVPQGSILSVTLFIIKINSIVGCVRPEVDNSLFVDDFHRCYRSRNMRAIERKLQHHLNRLAEWADENGFKFSLSKKLCGVFTQTQRSISTKHRFLWLMKPNSWVSFLTRN